MEIAPNVYIKKLFFKLGTGERLVVRHVYVALIKGEKNCLIDTGTAGNFEDIVDFCGECGVTIADLNFIINTHCHPDHIGADALFKKSNPGIILCAHHLAVANIADIETQHRQRPVPGFFNLISGSTNVDRFLDDNDSLDIGRELRILHTPGHSEDSISVFIPDEDVLIIGDSIPGKNDVPIYENLRMLKSSMLKLQKTEARHVVSAFDGYCEGISNVVKGGEEYIDRVDAYVREFVQATNIDPKEMKKDGLLLNEMCTVVLEKMGFKNHPPLPIIVTSIKSHLIDQLSFQ